MVKKRDLLVQVGRVCLINYGEDAGKLCTVLDIVDQNRALVDGPSELTGVHRQTINFRRLALTPLALTIPRSARPSTLARVMKEDRTVEKFAASNWGRKLLAQRIKRTLNDFDRFKRTCERKKRGKLIKEEVAKLRKTGLPKVKPVQLPALERKSLVDDGSSAAGKGAAGKGDTKAEGKGKGGDSKKGGDGGKQKGGDGGKEKKGGDGGKKGGDGGDKKEKKEGGKKEGGKKEAGKAEAGKKDAGAKKEAAKKGK